MNFSYDGTERRVYKKDKSSETVYLHDGMNAIVEKTKTGQSTEYIYGATALLAMKTNGALNFVLKDHLGSTRVVVDASGTVVFCESDEAGYDVE